MPGSWHQQFQTSVCPLQPASSSPTSSVQFTNQGPEWAPLSLGMGDGLQGQLLPAWGTAGQGTHHSYLQPRRQGLQAQGLLCLSFTLRTKPHAQEGREASPGRAPAPSQGGSGVPEGAGTGMPPPRSHLW